MSQQNIFGSGNALIAAINTSKVNRTISLAFTEPYWTVDGVSRTLEIYDKLIDPTSLSVSRYESSDHRRGGQLRHPDHRDRHHQRRLPLRAHDITLFDDSPLAYVEYVLRVRQPHRQRTS